MFIYTAGNRDLHQATNICWKIGLPKKANTPQNSMVYDPFPFWPNSNLEHVETTAKNMWLLRCDRFLRLGLKVKPVSSASTGAH
jgi:hypothetical protein